MGCSETLSRRLVLASILAVMTPAVPVADAAHLADTDPVFAAVARHGEAERAWFAALDTCENPPQSVSEKTITLPERPQSVPPEAIWNENYQEWELAELLPFMDGLVRRWRSDGTLASQFSYRDGKLDGAMSFHPKGERSWWDAWAVDWSPTADEVSKALGGPSGQS
jgi:hypothetical protein